MSDLQTEIQKLRGRAEYMAELPKDPKAEGWVLTALTADEWQERAEAQAKLHRERMELVEEKTEKARHYTARIKVLDEALDRLADEVETKQKWTDPQLPLPTRLAEAKKSRRAVQRGQQDAHAPVEP